jgi:MFS family permease
VRSPNERRKVSGTRGEFAVTDEPAAGAVVCVANFGAMVSFYLLFPVAPLLVERLGGNGALSGLATGIIMLTTLVAEFSSAFLQRRFSGRTLLGTALVLLVTPSALPGFAASPRAVLGVCGIRGLGLGLSTACW